MLYATTRSKVETFTAQRALKESRAPDGGLYLPVQVPVFTDGEILGLRDRVASDILSDVLNRFWNCKLSQWDVEFNLGKELYALTRMSHRILIAELWNHSASGLRNLERALTELISVEVGVSEPGAWMRVSVRIALLFAVFGELERQGVASLRHPVDVVVVTGDFVSPFAAWYARRMGLPIATVVCCCNENGGLWDLLNRGQMKLGGKITETNTPKCDILVPGGLEWMVHTVLDRDETAEYLEALKNGSVYELNKEQHIRIRKGMYASVVSNKRLPAVISNVYRTNGYILCPYSALTYAGLMDYRSVTGERRLALMLSEQNPMESGEQVASALGIPQEALREKMNLL